MNEHKDDDGAVHDEAQFRARQTLQEDLRALCGGVEVPPEVDARILTAARARLARPRRRFARFGWGAAAAAAVLVISALLVSPANRAPFLAPSVKLASRSEDVNRDGNVDILDAFALARQIEAAKPIGVQSDMNADGIVDRKDVDILAQAAVSLDRRSLL